MPFALVGGIWLLYLLGYNLSVAGAVGFIALAGMSAEFGVIVLLHLKTAWKQRIAAPMVGGMITALLLSMFVVPAAYLLMRRPRNQPETRTRHPLPV